MRAAGRRAPISPPSLPTSAWFNCAISKLDQIRKWRTDFKPERVVPYATAEEKITGTTIAANGAAGWGRRKRRRL
ncbi:DUF930 domain-containing protein [Mesorhizobium sangaii]|uniref:DUF930 domain-containing protein n=1 Tax=Mesorhizobium sangaii TaxID=505389 RepID=UPI0031B598A6